MAVPKRMRDAAGWAFRKITVWTSGSVVDVATSPTLTSGSGAPTASEPKGSAYLRTGGTGAAQLAYVAIDSAGAWAPLGGLDEVADPGDGQAIPVTKSAVIGITTAGAETNTLAIPTFVGQRLVLYCDTYVGDRVVTVAAPFNVANNTILTFGAASEACELVAVKVGGSLVWQLGWNDGVGLS